MSTAMMVELFGYLGSLLVVVSMLMSSVIKLRVINLTGSVIFAIYALIIRSYPTAVMNFFLAGINIFYLIRLLATQRHFELIHAGRDSGMLDYILTFYQDDIQKFYPEFQKHITAFDTAYMVLSDTVPAGVLLGTLEGNGTLDVVLDYATPAYRDCSVGRFLYERLPEHGIEKLLLKVPTKEHDLYLQKMGFEKEDRGYAKEL